MELVNSQHEKVFNKSSNDVLANGLLLIDELHHRFQKLKDKPYNFVDASGISVGEDQDEPDVN